MNKTKAFKWVNNMKPYGMKLNLDEVNRLLKDKQCELNPLEFFVVSNMIFNDYNEIILDDIDLLFNVTKCWLKNNDLSIYYKYKKH